MTFRAKNQQTQDEKVESEEVQMSFADDEKDKGANVSPTQFETPIQKDKSYEHQGQGSRVADKAKESLLIM